MSTTSVTYPIVGAVKGAEAIIGPDREWRGANERQKRFITEYFEPCRAEIDRVKEIETKASWKHTELNRFLKKKGFSITLDPFKDGEFGVASVLDLLVEWLSPGTKVPIALDGTRKEYPGVRLSHGVRFYRAGGAPLALIETKSGDIVGMTAYRGKATGFDLIDQVEAVAGNKLVSTEFAALRFPMVDLNHEDDISWLKGMATVSERGQGQKISQAKQQTKLRMNEKGARAQSAVAIGVVATSVARPKPDMVIDTPFLVWFARAGLSKPLFVGHITPEDWKAPKDLKTA